MHKKGFTSGFTLIELLVVIAIIGILASVILVSLNSARVGGTDAKVKSQLASMRTQSEFYNGATTAVANVSPCTTATANLFGTASNGLGILLGGLTLTGSECSYAGTTLPSDGGAWAVAVSLSSGAWCVDSTGWSNDKNKTTGAAYTTAAAAITTTACI